MFGKYFQEQLKKQNKKLQRKQRVYQPLQIPIDRVTGEFPQAKRVRDQCRKLKSEFGFIKHEIMRISTKKKRIQLSSYRKTMNPQRNSFDKSINYTDITLPRQRKEEINNTKQRINKSEFKEDVDQRKISPSTKMSVRSLIKLLVRKKLQSQF